MAKKKRTKTKSNTRGSSRTKGASKGRAAAKRRSTAGSRRPQTPSRSSRPKARSKAARSLLAVGAGVELYDLVCSIDDVLERGLAFAACAVKAQEHNDARPGHDAQPIRQQA